MINAHFVQPINNNSATRRVAPFLPLLAAIIMLGVFSSSSIYAVDTAQKVLNEHISLQWMKDGVHAWYQRDITYNSHEFILVNAKNKTREVAFDHEALARSLSALDKKKYLADFLPITSLELVDEGKTWLIAVKGQWWETPRQIGSLVASTRQPASTIDREPRPTRRTGVASQLTIHNKTDKKIDLLWSDNAGKRKRYAEIGPDEKSTQNTYDGHVWIAQDGSDAILGVVEASVTDMTVIIDGVNNTPAKPRINPNNSPDGAWRVQVRDHNIWLQPTAGGEAVALTTDGNEEHAYTLPAAWAPDSSYVVAMRKLRGDQRTITLITSSPDDQVQPTQRTIRYAKPGDKIDTEQPCLFRIADRQRIAVDVSLLENPWSIKELTWLPDSSAFTMLYNQRGHQTLRVVEINRDGKARALINETSTTFIDYNGKLFYQPIPEQQSIIWMSERDGWNHLYRYDAKTGQVKNQITKGQWVVRSVERVDVEAGLIWFTAGGLVPGEDPYYIHHCRVAFDGSGMTRLTAGDGSHSITWSSDGQWLHDTWSRVDLPPQHALRDGQTGKLIVNLEQADAKQLLASGWHMPERFVAKGRDGTTDIYGVIWRPREFDADKKYAVVENIYAGPHSAYVPKTFRSRYGQQKIADLGFVVAMIDGMGTSHRSKAFHHVSSKNIADAGFPDRIAWWKSAASTRPWMDLSRVGIYGGSAGGQNSLGALLFYPDFYHVAVSDCGCHDNRMDKIGWNELWMGWPIGPHYAEQSNVTNAHKLQGKLMLIVGELDDNVDPQSTHQVAHALEKANKDFELVVVHGKGHAAADTPYGSRKRAGFLVRHLLGKELADK